MFRDLVAALLRGESCGFASISSGDAAVQEPFEPLVERFLVNGKTVVISFPSRDCQK
jgi:hypothetical protein